MRSAAFPACASSIRTRSRAQSTRRAWCSCARRPSDRADPARTRHRNIFRTASRTARTRSAAISWITCTGIGAIGHASRFPRSLLLRPASHRLLHAALRQRHRKRATANFTRGCGFQGYSASAAAGIARSTTVRASARELKQRLRKPGPWEMCLFGFGEMLPRADNRVTLHASTQGSLGLAAGAHRLHASARTSAGSPSAPTSDAVQMLMAAGFENVAPLGPASNAAGHDASTKWAPPAWASTPRPRCSIGTTRRTTSRTCSSPTARA